jgi:hypothetical protein
MVMAGSKNFVSGLAITAGTGLVSGFTLCEETDFVAFCLIAK